ncbi:glycosyltransferase [Haladaptatus salinisoli]|uniref:glycosyltransferase n=1 Tax=Haladaptatus salinisoli TaxID=2884876 RepID=UPI001D0A78AD|nr:glycosyltransferase [Haladaptatus salinisoli]
MARILVLCSRTPYPLVGGAKVRLFNTARLLADDHTVDLLVVDESPVDQSAVSALDEAFDDVTVFSYPGYRFHLNTVPGLASRRPLQTHYFSFSAVERWLDGNLRKYDLAFCNHVRTTEYVRGYDIPKVVDFVDAISRNYEASGEHAEGIWRAIYPIESRRLLRYERRIAEEFDHSFIITEEDKRYVEGSSRYESLSVLPNGVKGEILERGRDDAEPDAPEDGARLVFLGKMDYFPNEDAATFFAESVFPRVRADRPNAEFLVVGASPTERVRALDSLPGVTVTGFVDDPVDYLEDAHVVVAPMRHGAGLQNKILEAMGLGKAVVTTPLGREGIDAESDEHLRVGETPDELARQVVELLDDGAERERIGRRARERIEERYTWEEIRPRLLGRVNDVLG